MLLHCNVSSFANKYTPKSVHLLANIVFNVLIGWMWGDPHIATIDGKKYSYQGLGNFWLLKGDTVQVQGKTRRIQTANGALSRGTVWSGIAIKDIKIIDNSESTPQTEETTINVQLTTDSKGLYLYAWEFVCRYVHMRRMYVIACERQNQNLR